MTDLVAEKPRSGGVRRQRLRHSVRQTMRPSFSTTIALVWRGRPVGLGEGAIEAAASRGFWGTTIEGPQFQAAAPAAVWLPMAARAAAAPP